MTKKILITGGSGFIGSEVVRLACARGFEVRNLDVLPPRLPEHAQYWRNVDMRQASDVEREVLSFDPEIVFHLASDIDVNIRTLSEFKTTIDGTANILSAVAKLDGLKNFIHTSTQFVVRPGIEPLNEKHLEPYTVYGEAKAEAEKLVWAANLKMAWYILRPTIIWGPNHPSFAQQIFKHMASRTYLHPIGRDPIIRAYGYVTNVAEQMLGFAALKPGATKKHVYYLGDDSIDYDKWADAFSIGLTGKSAKRIPIGLLKLLGQAGDVLKGWGVGAPIDSGRAFRMSTSSKIDLDATHLVAGKPSVGFDEGVAKTLEWLKAVYTTGEE